MRKLWPFLYYVCIFAAFAAYGPFMVLYYQDLGFNGAQIGLITGLTPLIVLVCSPLLTGLADAFRLHRLVMSVSIFVSASLLALFPLFRAYLPILALVVVMQIFIAPMSALADSATMHMLGSERDQYGKVRLGGTLGFGLSAAISGSVVQRFGLRGAIWTGALILLLALLVSQKLEHDSHQASSSDRGNFRKLLTSPRWLLFLIAALGGGIATAATNTYMYPFLDELGASEKLMGYTITLGTLFELPVLWYGSRMVKRLTPYRLFVFGLLVTCARFFLFSLATSPAWIMVLQVLNGLTFGAMWLGGVAYAYDNAPPGLSASAQGMLGAMVFGFGAAVGNFSGGLLFERLGGAAMYLVFAVVVLALTLITTLLQARLARRAAPA